MELNNNNINNSQSTSNQTYQEDFQRNMYMEYDQKINQFTFQQIEIYLQNQYGVNVPAIVFEYSGNVGKDFIGWDYEDLIEFFSHFGEIETLEINGKLAYILFKTFFDANTAREFLKNDTNFKDTEKNNFNVRWFNNEDANFISDELRSKIQKMWNKFFEGMNTNNNFNQFNMMNGNGNGMKMNQMMINNNMNMGNNLSVNKMNNNNFYMMMNQNEMMNNGSNNNNNLNTNNNFNTNNNLINLRSNLTNGNNPNNLNQNFNQLSGNNNRKNSNTGKDLNDDKDDKKNNQNGKYTCRFEIQIENEKEFQVARRLIGAKGCNMKKIVEMCSKKPDGCSLQDAVKLRLRGKGSGYKEGPFNKESDEPLHLCISSKFFDRYKIAIQLVNELVASVYEEYKRYCEKMNKTPVAFLAIKKEEGISSRKSTVPNKNDYEF